MFIAILTYKKPLGEVDRYLAAHREYLARHYAAGDFIASGPQTPRVGGVIMMKAYADESCRPCCRGLHRGTRPV